VSIEVAVRARRRQLGLTLQTLAKRSGVSVAMLSEVERGRKSPTIRIACQIAEGLECTISDLLEVPPPPAILVQRRTERPRLVERKSRIERHVMAAPLRTHGIEVVWYVVPPRSRSGSLPPHRPGVLAHCTIVSGSLESRAGAERILLRKGDSMTYNADLPHAFRNPGQSVCEFFLVIDASQAPVNDALPRRR
jgi:transcriptional regulator with XRE-family HTH domain